MSDIELIALVLEKYGMENIARDLINAAKLRDEMEYRQEKDAWNEAMEVQHRYGRD